MRFPIATSANVREATYPLQPGSKTSSQASWRRRRLAFVSADAKEGPIPGHRLFFFDKIVVGKCASFLGLFQLSGGCGGIDCLGGQRSVGQDGDNIIANLGEAPVHVITMDSLIG